jgi:YVTN family beta-propeller protein
VAFDESDAEVWALGATHLYRMNWRNNKVMAKIPLNGAPGLQGVAFDAESKEAFAAVRQNPNGPVKLLHAGSSSGMFPDGLGTVNAGAIALSQRVAVVPLIANNKLAVVDRASGRLSGTVDVPVAPFGAVVNQAGTVAYVSNWGGRVPGPKDKTATTGLNPKADAVVVDERGIAASGTVTRVDLAEMKATHVINVKLHPTAMAWDESGGRLYVANTNSDAISVINTATQAVVQTIALEPFAQKAPGIAPTALAYHGGKLYAACGGINAVLVIQAATGKIEGMIPTAWYPNGLSVSPSGKQLAVSALLGPGSAWREAPAKRYVHANRGSVHVVDLPDAAQLASYTTAVARNTLLDLPGTVVPAVAADRKPRPVPFRAGDPTPIEYVFYIIKENRTYDQLFGDLAKGNGEPSFVMFGADVSPNQRKLAEEFVLLDNFYATGGNSADGHQWVTQANETSYPMWPGYQGRSYPFDGTDPIAYSSSGFLWDNALKRGKTVRIYGEYAGLGTESAPGERINLLNEWKNGGDFSTRWTYKAPIEPLNKILAANFPPYTLSVPDVVRAQIFRKDFAKWEAEGKMPNLVIIQLPSDHTSGTSPRRSTPKAMVADNDLAVGQIVETISKSKFWAKSAIFIVEDDAQNGVDHVDGHRTIALAISPYIRRGHVDSTFYSHQSMVKTIELMLGLPSMTLFDLIANDMRASFTDTPDLTPFTAITPKQDLWELNPAVSALNGPARRAALDSQRMKWDAPDAAPTGRLNEILWGATQGWNTPFPGVRQAVFAPMAIDLDDDERRGNTRGSVNTRGR